MQPVDIKHQRPLRIDAVREPVARQPRAQPILGKQHSAYAAGRIGLVTTQPIQRCDGPGRRGSIVAERHKPALDSAIEIFRLCTGALVRPHNDRPKDLPVLAQQNAGMRTGSETDGLNLRKVGPATKHPKCLGHGALPVGRMLLRLPRSRIVGANAGRCLSDEHARLIDERRLQTPQTEIDPQIHVTASQPEKSGKII